MRSFVLAALLVAFMSRPGAADDAAKLERTLALGHTADVVALAAAKDGTRLASIDQNGILRLWSLPDAGALAEIATGVKNLLQPRLFFSPDGSKLAFRDDSNGVRLFDGRTGQPLAKPALPANVTDVSGDVKRASSGGTLYDLATGKILATLAPSPNRLCLNGDGSLGAGLVWNGKNGFDLTVWELPSGRTLWRQPDQANTHDFAFSPDGRTLTQFSYTGIRLLDVQSGSEIAAIPGKGIYQDLPAYSPDGSLFALTGSDYQLNLFSAAGQAQRVIKPSADGFASGNLEAAAFSADARILYAAPNRGNILEFNIGDGSPAGGFGPTGSIRALAMSPDSRTIAAAFSDSGVVLLDAATGKLVRSLDTELNVVALAFSPNGRRLATGGNGPAKVLETATGRVVYTLGGNNIASLSFSPDGKRLLVGSDLIKSSLYNMETGDLIKSLDTTGVLGGYAPDGKHVAIAQDHTVVLWNPATGVTVRDFAGLDQDVKALAFSPDGKLFAAGTAVGPVGVWQAGSGKLLRTFTAGGGVVGLWFIDGGRKLLAAQGASSGLQAAIYDADSGAAEAGSPVTGNFCAVLSPDRWRLITCNDRAIDIWRVSGAPAPVPAAVARHKKVLAARTAKRGRR